MRAHFGAYWLWCCCERTRAPGRRTQTPQLLTLLTFCPKRCILYCSCYTILTTKAYLKLLAYNWYQLKSLKKCLLYLSLAYVLLSIYHTWFEVYHITWIINFCCLGAHDIKVNKTNFLKIFDCTTIKFRIILEVIFAPPFQITICHTRHILCLALATKFAEEGNV